MAAASVKQWGLTPAISTALPTPADVALNSALIEELKRQNNYESPAETTKRCVAESALAYRERKLTMDLPDKQHCNSFTKSPSNS